jgi:hypothetical protein
MPRVMTNPLYINLLKAVLRVIPAQNLRQSSERRPKALRIEYPKSF